MHGGVVLPLPESEKKEWLALQEASDAVDTYESAKRVRTAPLESVSYAKKVKSNKLGIFRFPHAQKAELPNGLEILYYNNPTVPKITLIFEFKTKYYYDPEDKQGLSNFMTRMVQEGTKNYTAEELANALESRGMQLRVSPGAIAMSMLKEDLEEGFSLLHEIITNATFPKEKMEKVRTQIFSDIKNFWDNPSAFSGQLVKGMVYQGHPYSKDALGTEESIASITREDLIDAYKKYMIPDQTVGAVVGDIAGIDIPCIIEKALGKWNGAKVAAIDFPALHEIKAHEEVYPINRDQVVLCMAGRSIKRTDSDFDKLLLFDQVFGMGVIGSMISRLFKIRQETGLFYTINGSVIAHADEQPGMVIIKAITSPDRVKDAIKRIEQVVDTVADSIQQDEIEDAKRAIANAIIGNFESNGSIAQSFLYLARYGLAEDYFDKRAATLEPITVDEVKKAVKKILAKNKLVTLLVGRVAKQDTEK